MGIPDSSLPHLLHGLHPSIQLQGEEAATTAALLLPDKATPLPLSSCSPVVQVSGLNCIPVGPQDADQQPTAKYVISRCAALNESNGKPLGHPFYRP